MDFRSELWLNRCMKAIPLRVQLWAIGVGYAAVALYGGSVLYARHLAELQNPIESQGGMWAFGDEIATLSIFCAFCVPTFFLMWVIRNYEHVYTTYSKVLLAVSATAPLSLALVSTSKLPNPGFVYDALVMRLWRAPMFFVVFVMSRLFARAKLAKRLTNISIVVEGGTLVIVVAGLLLLSRLHS
jgi:hypothetical protein